MLSTASLAKISRPSPGVFTSFQITSGTGSNKRLNISSHLKISGDLTLEMGSVRQTPTFLGMGQVRKHIKRQMGETSLVVQRLRFCMANAGGAGLIPGQGTKIRQALKLDQKKKSQMGARVPGIGFPPHPLPTLAMLLLLLPGGLSQGRAGPRDCGIRLSTPCASLRNLHSCYRHLPNRIWCL